MNIIMIMSMLPAHAFTIFCWNIEIYILICDTNPTDPITKNEIQTFPLQILKIAKSTNPSLIFCHEKSNDLETYYYRNRFDRDA